MKSRKEEPPSKIPLLGRTGLLSRSLQVNSSPPTTSSTDFAPTTTPTYQEITETIVLNSGYVCDPNPETCGCPALLLTDYRGSINTTADGLQCEKWPDDIMQAYPNGGIVENYCRNPVNDQGGPFCFVRTGPDDLEIGFCDVPICAALTAPPTVSAVPTSSTRPTGSPSSSSLPSSSSSPTQHCLVADNEVCGCEAVQQSDYRGTISTTVDGLVCERWDSELVGILKLFGFDLFGEFPNAGLDENFCRNPGNNEDGPYCFTPEIDENSIPIEGHCNIPKCDPCACTPQCGEPNPESCACPSFFQADSCCNEDDAMCKCRYLKDACRISLENNSTDFCDDAEDACCEGKGEESHSYCKCNMYEQICSDAPSQATCDFAASSCCESEHDVTESNNRCLCDFYTHSAIFFESAFKIGNCSSPNANEGFTVPGLEKILLENLYFLCEGENWFDDTGWLDDTIPHCQWFGLKCNDEGLLVEINLRNNNLTGIADYLLGGVDFPRLTKLDVGGNQLTGKLRSADINRHRRLVYIDISENNFSGHADMTFPPTTLHANYSHNNFASVSFKRFNPVYETLQVVDLSHNRISQYTSEIFLNIPHNLRELILSNNQLKGPLPDPFPLEDVRRFVIANNSINGDLPYFPTPLLRELDLSDQNQAENGGLTGTVRDDHLENLEAIYLLNLAGNKLSGDIPSSLGVKQYLQVLNLSSNALDKSIPTELGKLKDVLEVLDLSTNELTGTIPLELANLDGALVQLHLSGNNISSNPVPLDLCFLTGFDLAKDAELCPPERNALKNFYDSAKGGEWTESKSWLDPVTSHCDWYGVSCNDQSNHAIKLELRNNGLSGKLSEKIAALTSLEVLDLSDNGIKGMIPAAVGNLANLKYLRLCYNEFIGDQTNFENLQHLELVQIQGNRLSGSIPSPNMLISGPSSFVSDCGNPSEFGESLVCDDCSMCCNAQGDCFSTEENHIQKVGINKHVWFSLLFIACLFAASGALALVVYAHDKYQHQSLPRSSSRIDRDEKYALSTIGEDSVYQFFLGKNISGWIIVLLTLAAQTWLLFIFVKSAESDWTDDGSALVYTWKCPRDEDECEDSGDVDWTGWLAFTILMAAHLLKDVINGTKLILLSAKERHDRHTRMRFFIGGTLLATVASFTFYVSAIYNAAIATDNREIIENSVIILFICDIDELLFDILMVANQGWVNGMLREEKQEEEPASETVIQEKVDEEGGLNRDLEHYANDNVASEDQFVNDKNLVGTVEHLTKAVKTLQETVKQQNEQLRLLLNCRESAAEC